MSTTLFVALVAVFVVGVLGIVAAGSTLQPAQDERDLRLRLDRHATSACEDDNLLPEGASKGDAAAMPSTSRRRVRDRDATGARRNRSTAL
jgi:hypothetical protein